MVWPEVRAVADGNRRELILGGQEITKRIDGVYDNGLDATIFALEQLNFLEVSRTTLKHLPASIGRLSHLTKLSLHSNELDAIPPELGSLICLRHLDLSRNKIAWLPDAIFVRLDQLLVLNLSTNLLADVSDIGSLLHLTLLDISHNRLTSFPASLLVGPTSKLSCLAEVRARANAIVSVPAALEPTLPALKLLDLEDNQVKSVAGEIGDCTKLKDINLRGNPLEDRRLKKLVEQSHSASSKPILDYIRSNCSRESSARNGAGDVTKEDKTKRKKKKGGKDKEVANKDKAEFIRVVHGTEDVPVVHVAGNVADVRPYIVCCVLQKVNLLDPVQFKSFITLQTKLHDNNCKYRTLATIATHDLAKIRGKKLIYSAQKPTDIKILPLSRQSELSAAQLFGHLLREAETVRKEKKRNTYSGIHKYLHLLEGKQFFPCLTDDGGRVISFPPITNSEYTKITPETVDIFIEVTSSTSLGVCKEVMDAFVHEVATLVEIPVDDDDDAGGGGRTCDHESEDKRRTCRLVVQQALVVDWLGNLKVMYPSQPDLKFDDLDVVRE